MGRHRRSPARLPGGSATRVSSISARVRSVSRARRVTRPRLRPTERRRGGVASGPPRVAVKSDPAAVPTSAVVTTPSGPRSLLPTTAAPGTQPHAVTSTTIQMLAAGNAAARGDEIRRRRLRRVARCSDRPLEFPRMAALHRHSARRTACSHARLTRRRLRPTPSVYAHELACA
jgi:hypothetical protein